MGFFCIHEFFFVFFCFVPREVMEKDAKDYADSIHAIFVETSAKNAININELFIEISKYLNSLISKYLNYFLLQKT